MYNIILNICVPCVSESLSVCVSVAVRYTRRRSPPSPKPFGKLPVHHSEGATRLAGAAALARGRLGRSDAFYHRHPARGHPHTIHARNVNSVESAAPFQTAQVQAFQ